MLRYMNRGIRCGPNAHPLGVPRNNWEFLAVIRGRIRPVFIDRPAPAFETHRLWLLAPESTHSWTTPPGQSCTIVVFHFAAIDPLLEASLPAARTLSIPLSASDTRFISDLNRELWPHYESPRLSSAVRFEAAMLRLSALFLDSDHAASELTAFDAGAATVFQAIQWHRQHLAEGVSVNDVAAALHLSPSHLRRLFLRIRHESPKRAFMRTTLAEACRLMAHPALSLKEVGARCGFNGFSEFYRAFKNHTGQSPSCWRSNHLYRGLGLGTSAKAPPLRPLAPPPIFRPPPRVRLRAS